MEPLVSVVIPAYNAELWVGEAITSATRQTWKRTEVIVVDDGSSDETLTAARVFEGERVKVVSQERRGACAARNRGIELAQGDFIQYLDADDSLDSRKIESQLRIVKSEANSRILASGKTGWFLSYPSRAIFPSSSPVWKDLAPVDWLVAKFSLGAGLHIASWLVSRRLIELGGPWHEELLCDQDGEYFCRVVAASEYVTFSDEARNYYRTGIPTSISSTRSRQWFESLYRSTVLHVGYLLELEDSERTRLACIRHLERRLFHFHPTCPDLIEAMQELGRKLGATNLSPLETPRFRRVRRLIGWRAAKELKHQMWRWSLSWWRVTERLLWLLKEGRGCTCHR